MTKLARSNKDENFALSEILKHDYYWNLVIPLRYDLSGWG